MEGPAPAHRTSARMVGASPVWSLPTGYQLHRQALTNLEPIRSHGCAWRPTRCRQALRYGAVMEQGISQGIDLGRVGAWWSGSWTVADEPELNTAADMEALGYTALWSSGGFDPGLSSRFATLLDATRTAAVASGIVSIWADTPDVIGPAVAELEARHPGRFLLGLGTSHSAIVADYSRPYSKMVAFLDGLDSLDARTVRPARAARARRAGDAHARAGGRARRRCPPLLRPGRTHRARPRRPRPRPPARHRDGRRPRDRPGQGT